MKNVLRKLFGGIELSWPKVILGAVAAGVYTAVITRIPGLHDTSFISITTTLEVWILFGILIIMNSKSNLDSALKCFVFFLISQPLVYLIQVPFSQLGWSLFGFYRFWFIWTLLCFPMGFIGYYMKKDKWWGYLILLPMIGITGWSYMQYFSDLLFSSPRYILITLFCAVVMVLYPAAIFRNRKIRIAGAVIGGILVIALTVLGLFRPPVYSTELLLSGDDCTFDDTCSVRLADERLGSVTIRHLDGIDCYAVYADFRHAGSSILTLTYPSGETKEFDFNVERDTYRITER